MKLVCYKDKQATKYGVLQNDKIFDLPRMAEHMKTELPDSLEDFIAYGENYVGAAERMLTQAKERDVEYASIEASQVAILTPLPSPGKIICLGLNYRDHAAEQNVTVPDEPIIFMKPRTSIIGPNESIIKPSFVAQLDYEAELAIVIGKKTKNIAASDASSHVFGFSILNDVSARDIQFKDRQWTRGKSFDTFAPIGPCIVTANQLLDTSDLSIQTWVNDELRQDSSTRHMVFSISETVRHLSKVMTLEPSDIIATGTPAGVGFAHKPQPTFLEVGDKVKIMIEGIGILENTVADESQTNDSR